MSDRIPLRVLVLEDSEFDARVMVQSLRTGGYDIHSRRVETADAMLDALREGPWDIVLADYNMPNFNAPQALRLLQGEGLDIPFIIVSGGIGEDVAVAAMKAGAHDYVMKGNPARLLPAVARELREALVRRERRESEMRYRTLWETSPDAVLLCDETGVIRFANPAAQQVFGWPAAQFSDLPLSTLEPAGGGGLGQALASAALPAPAPVTQTLHEGPARRHDGSVILVEVASSRLDLSGRHWFVLFARDITEKRRNESELRAREEQMRAAREIQQRLFPRHAPHLPGFDLAGTSVPADLTGGDYYDFIPMADGRLGLVVADVSGHGLGPSLLMAETRALLRAVARDVSDPGDILARVNPILAEDVEQRNYVTLVLARLDPATGELVHASAGHPEAFVLAPDGSIKARLRRTGGVLGFRRGPTAPSSSPIHLTPGDVLILYTDGIKEALEHGQGDEFGLDRLIDVARHHRAHSARDILNALCQAAQNFVAPAQLEDDLTVLVLKSIAIPTSTQSPPLNS